jgi:hypothetical protein
MRHPILNSIEVVYAPTIGPNFKGDIMLEFVSAALVLCLTGGIASAATLTLDFDVLRGDISGLDLGGVTLTSGTNDVSVGLSGAGSFALFSLDSIFGTAMGDRLFRADFGVSGVSSVSIDLGDGRLFNPEEDLDDLLLEAYDARGVVLDRAFASIQSTFDIYLALQVNAPNISYVRFGGVDPNGFNTVYADNLSFTYDPVIAPVPLPASAALLAGALGFLGITQRRRFAGTKQTMLQRSV